MAYEIEWTENAKQDLYKIIEYLRDEWSVDSAWKFVDRMLPGKLFLACSCFCPN
jgi:plasmid stabilization system protein ParE